MFYKNLIAIFRALHIILALLVLFSSSGLILNRHFCRNELKSASLFLQAEPCHQEKMVNCPLHNTEKKDGDQDDAGCCDDTTDYVKLESDQLIPTSGIDIQLTPVLIAAIFVALNIDIPSLDTRSLHYFNYKPPLIVCDLPVSLQTFLC